MFIVVSRVIRLSNDFYLYFMDFCFCSKHALFLSSEHHLNKVNLCCLFWYWTLSAIGFIVKIRPGALDKAISINRTTFKCDPRKKWQIYWSEQRYFQLEEIKCGRMYRVCLEHRTYLKMSEYFRQRDTTQPHVLPWLAP